MVTVVVLGLDSMGSTVATDSRRNYAGVDGRASDLRGLPDDPGPLATDVSGAITHTAVRYAAKKVADWELARAQPVFNQQWTFAASV